MAAEDVAPEASEDVDTAAGADELARVWRLVVDVEPAELAAAPAVAVVRVVVVALVVVGVVLTVDAAVVVE